MTDKIEPALTAEEWGRGETVTPDHVRIAVDGSDLEVGDGRSSKSTWVLGADSMPQFIALANAVLPDSDRRKITREKVRDIRNSALKLESMHIESEPPWPHDLARSLRSFADAIESYLPPARGMCPELAPGQVKHLFQVGKTHCQCGEKLAPGMGRGR